MSDKMSDAEFLRDVVGGCTGPKAGRLRAIADRLAAIDAQEPSDTECVVWALRNEVLLHGMDEFDSGVEWVYRFLRSTEVFRVKNFDGQLPVLSPAVFADIRRRMKGSQP